MHGTTLNPKEIVNRILKGHDVPRCPTGPLAVHYCAKVAGVSLREYTMNPRAMADSIIRYCERFRPDAVWLSADTWINAQAMGASVAFPDDNQPLSGACGPLVRSPSDIDRIPPPDPATQGRWPIMLQALHWINEALGKDVFIVACFDQYPFSLACAVMGIEQVMIRLHDDLAMVQALMTKCSEYAVAYALALADVGAGMLSGGDSPAGLLGPNLYRQVALPFEKKVISEIRLQTAVPVSLHICGDSTRFLSDMAGSGAAVLELDHQVDIAAACRIIGPEIAFWGNLDPVCLLARGSPDQVRRATVNLLDTLRACGHRRFVLSSGCTLAIETPPENLEAMFAAATGCN